MSLEILDRAQALTEKGLVDFFANLNDVPSHLLQAMRYSCLNGGKRIRPSLILASGRCCQLSEDKVLPLLLAVEMLHCFSLVHDDLPCMDDDDLRRGRPATHKQFDEATALLAGDALLAQATDCIFASTLLADQEKLIVLRQIALAIGSAGMIGGQVLDMQSLGKTLDADSLFDIHYRKTGRLIQVCCTLPTYLMSDENPDASLYHEKLNSVGEHLGVGFQIVDDILDETSSTKNLGKPSLSDRQQGHFTYTSLYGLAGARDHAQRHYEAALSALDELGSGASDLKALTQLIFERGQ